MKFRALILAVLGAIALIAPLSLAGSAEAAVPKRRLTCGMSVTTDMDLYLRNDLSCPGGVVSVYQAFDDDGQPRGDQPTVHVDLRGHTLTGPGGATAITSLSDVGRTAVDLTVRNGTLRGWGTAVSAGTITRLRHVRLIDNDIALKCDGSCFADHVVIKRNGEGIHVSPDGYAHLTHSKVIGNDLGASTQFIWGIDVEHTRFERNTVGIDGFFARPTVVKSLFYRNGTAIHITTDDPSDPQSCADLTKVRFKRNTTDVDGPICAAPTS